jgi:hypothetical protein
MEFSINNDRYVCYNANGEIEKISRRPDDILDSIKVQYDEVKDLLEGKLSIVNFRVEYDFLEKKFIIKSLEQFRNDQLITSFIYEIPTEIQDDYEIKIIQNNKNKCWQLEINPFFLKQLQEQNISFNPVEQKFSITKTYDPNVLYRIIKFDETYTVPYMYDFEFDNEQVSVYTIRKFSTYIHEVINE